MIDKILEEMFENCHACQGTGIRLHKMDSEEECPACNGDGYDLSYEGHKLQQAILKGEKP